MILTYLNCFHSLEDWELQVVVPKNKISDFFSRAIVQQVHYNYWELKLSMQNALEYNHAVNYAAFKLPIYKVSILLNVRQCRFPCCCCNISLTQRYTLHAQLHWQSLNSLFFPFLSSWNRREILQLKVFLIHSISL